MMARLKVGLSLILLLLPSLATAATVRFVEVVDIIQQPRGKGTIHPYAINLRSSRKRFAFGDISPGLANEGEWLYITRVKVDNVDYYRLVIGNFSSKTAVARRLSEIKKRHAEAWINVRPIAETRALREKSGISGERAASAGAAVKKPRLSAAKPAKAKAGRSGKADLAQKLLNDARGLFIDRKYSRVLATTDKIGQIGTREQRQQAMELAGLVRERQGKFAQAVAIYHEFLDQFPDSELKPRIESRLAGLKTMHEEPKAPLVDTQSSSSDWFVFGSVAQSYRNDSLDIDDFDTRELSDELNSDLYFLARRKTASSAYEFRFDGGLKNDFLADDDDGRINTAVINYANNAAGFKLSGGRQSRTATGIYQRFDGLLFETTSRNRVNFGLYLGAPVDSPYDDPDSRRSFYGGKLKLTPAPDLELDIFVVQQQVANLTDRQAVGSELQYHGSKGFLYGLLDYDLHFGELNNLTTIGNYRYSNQWTFNFTFDHRYTPLLSTHNAIGGTGVRTVDDLQSIHNLSDVQIEQLARDRSRRLTNLVLGGNYLADNQSQWLLNLGLSSIAESQASAAIGSIPAVAAVPKSDSIYISADYSTTNWLSDNDFSVAGIRYSDTQTARVLSLRASSRIRSASNRLTYDPSLRLDLRQNTATGADRLSLFPGFRLTYKASKRISLEADLDVELSTEELSNGTSSDETLYSILLGYIYQF